MLKHKLLGIIPLVKDNTYACGVIDDFTVGIVSQVVPSVMASVAVNVLKIKGRIRTLLVLSRW